MKRCFFLLCMVLFNFAAEAQIDTVQLSKNISAAEDSMVAISKRKDWKAYVDYMNPVVIDLSGGKEGFVRLLQNSKVFDSVDIQIFRVGKILQLSKIGVQHQCIVETFLQMKMSGKILSSSSYDIAISKDGYKWTFFRIAPTLTSDQIKKILPDLNQDFKFPRSQTEVGKTLEEFLAAYVIQYLE
jgi:hypothetical protein